MAVRYFGLPDSGAVGIFGKVREVLEVEVAEEQAARSGVLSVPAKGRC